MIQFVKTYKNLFHVLLGALFLAIFSNLLHFLGDLYFLPVFICCAFCAGFVEFIQPKLNLGTATGIGALKTLTIPIIFVLLESYHTIF